FVVVSVMVLIIAVLAWRVTMTCVRVRLSGGGRVHGIIQSKLFKSLPSERSPKAYRLKWGEVLAFMEVNKPQKLTIDRARFSQSLS
ncbi:hypothetical protein ACS2TC_27205, partial [Bacillus cereus group sp. BC44]|uniref:hypothetical protein n=1 Tax=Bacillus cereus group sp. BC44 TaxID=3445298 RepID=UPI003F2253FC